MNGRINNTISASRTITEHSTKIIWKIIYVEFSVLCDSNPFLVDITGFFMNLIITRKICVFLLKIDQIFDTVLIL
jgi:hypothetical protein